MAVDLALGYFAYAVTILSALVASYFYLLIFGEKAGAPNIDANLQRQIVSQVQQVVIQTTNTFVSPVLATWVALLKIFQLMVQNWKYVVLFAFITGFSILMHYEHQDLMSGIDQFWRCFGHTTFYNFFMPLIQTIRVVYGFLAPIYNIVVVTVLQIWRGSVQILLKCQVSTVFAPVKHFVLGTVELVQSFISFLGFDRIPLNENNNIAVNDWNIEPAVQRFVQVVNSTQIGMRCACQALDPAWDLIYSPVTSDHLPKAIDHWWNFMVRIVQLFLRIVVPPNEIPNIERVTYHMYGSILEFAFFLDHIVYTTIINLVRIFSVTLFDEASLATPKEFVFSSLARVGLTGIQVPLNIFAGVMELFTPRTIGNSAAMMNAFNQDGVWSNLYIANYDLSNSLHWVLYLVENIAGSIATGLTKPSTLPKTFSCNWVADYSPANVHSWPHAPHMVSYTAACSMYNMGLAALGIPLVVSELTKELFFKSIVLQEQNVLRVLQKYDGMWTSREEVTDCEARKRRATPYNGTYRVDWTIDKDRCVCDMRLGEYVAPDPNFYPKPASYRYASEEVYNPWCGQPTLQDQVFGPMDAALIYLTHGIFGPSGIGEILQYQKTPNTIPSLGVNIPSFPPTTRMVIEMMRVGVRLLLILPDMFVYNVVFSDINCGYGLNSTHLDYRYQILNGVDHVNGSYFKGFKKKWNSTSRNYDIIPTPFRFPTGDVELRWQPCMKRRFKFPGIPYNASYDMKTCTKTNEDGDCSCNFMLNLTIDSPCGCIATVPPLSTVADDNPVSKFIAYRQMTAASYRWCNSNYLEWFFFMQEQMLDSFAYMLALGPWNEDCKPPRQVDKDTDMSAYYIIATTTTTDSYNNEDTDTLREECLARPSDELYEMTKSNPTLKEYVAPKCDFDDLGSGLLASARKKGTCRLWGNHNIFCSLSMAWRQSGEWTVNVQRQIHSNIMQFLGGNLNKFDLDFKYRICDMEKAFAAQVSVLTNLFTAGLSRGPLKKAMGKTGIALWEYYQMWTIKLTNLLAQFALTFIDELKKVATRQTTTGAGFQEGLENNIKQLVKSYINLYMDLVILFVDGMGDFVDALKDGAGEFFRGISTVIKMVVNALSGTFLEIIGVYLDLFAELIAFFAGKGDLTRFLTKFFSVAFDIIAIMITNAQRVLSGIFMMLGTTIGGFLNALMSGVCAAINGVICALTFGNNCNIMTCVSGGFGNPEGQPLGSGYKHGQRLPKLFATHYHTIDGMPAPQWVAENIVWNGTSTCDMFMEGVRFYNYTEMRPLERATWLDCLEQRAIGQEFAKMVDIPEIHLYDVLYNYKRKWKIAFDLTTVVSIGAQIYVQDGTVTGSKLRKALVESNIKPDGPVKMFDGLGRVGGFLWDELKIENMFDDVLKLFDPQYNENERPTRTAKLYRASVAMGNAVNDVTNYWKREDMAKKGWKTFDTIHRVRNSNDFNWLKDMSDKTILGIPHHVKESIKAIGNHVRRTKVPIREKQRMYTSNPFKKPINTNIKFPDANSMLCPNPESPMCVQCVVIDNLLEITRDWTLAFGRFMVNVYTAQLQTADTATGFVQPGTLKDIEIYYIRMFTNNSGFIDDTQQLTRAKQKLHRVVHPVKFRLFSELYNSTSVPVTQRFVGVGRDWADFYGNATDKFIWGKVVSDDVWGTNVNKFVTGIKMFMSTVDSTYVPFFGYSVPYMVSFVFTESCDVEKAVWNENTAQSVRLVAIDKALFLCFVITTALILNGLWSVVPLGVLVNTIVLVQLNILLFWWIVYGYLPSCQPSIPHMLMEDLTEWIQLRIAPGCFCESWPVLTAKWCQSSTCYQCGIAAGQYRNCLDDIPLAKEWGVWWIIPMITRWLAPMSISWMAETGIVQEADGPIQTLIFDSFTNPNGTSTLEKECVWVTAGDLFINALTGTIVGYVFVQIVMALVQLVINMFLLIWQTVLLFQWTALAIEQSTRVDGDENEASDEKFSG
jgi:hypothetical protein